MSKDEALRLLGEIETWAADQGSIDADAMARKCSEVAAALSWPSGADAEAIDANLVADAMDGGKGFWRPCSGCHELNEGYPTGPFSKALKCNLGLGCHECGGIGAIWDTVDYADMGDFLAAPPLPEPVTVAPDLVERFTPTWSGGCGMKTHAHMQPASWGDWVRYIDYATLSANLDAMRRERDYWRRVALNSEAEVARLHDDLAEKYPRVEYAEAEVARLTARVGELEKGLERIAQHPSCGCQPCTGQCRSEEALAIEIEGLREIARALLPAKKEG